MKFSAFKTPVQVSLLAFEQTVRRLCFYFLYVSTASLIKLVTINLVYPADIYSHRKITGLLKGPFLSRWLLILVEKHILGSKCCLEYFVLFDDGFIVYFSTLEFI